MPTPMNIKSHTFQRSHLCLRSLWLASVQNSTSMKQRQMQAFRRGFGTFQVLQMLVARMVCHFAIKYDLECILLLLYFQVIIFVIKSFFSSACRRRTSLVPIAAARLIGIELGITMYLETRRLEISKDATHSAKANEEFFITYNSNPRPFIAKKILLSSAVYVTP